MPNFDAARALQSSQAIWDQEILPSLYEYIRIPNKSPAYEPRWQKEMDRAVALIEGWCRKQPIPGLSVQVVRLENRTPVIFMEIPGEGSETVLLYGHLDKQPEMTGWRAGLSPWNPVREGDKLSWKSMGYSERDAAYDNNNHTGSHLSGDWEDYADGRILSGTEAKRLGFVDELGDFETALSRARTIAGISESDLVQYQPIFDLSNLFHLFGKSDAKAVKVDLGVDVPQLHAGYMYFLSPTYLQ